MQTLQSPVKCPCLLWLWTPPTRLLEATCSRCCNQISVVMCVEEWGLCYEIHAFWSFQCLLISVLRSSLINLCNGCNKWNKRGIWNELSKLLSYVTTHESKWFWNFCRGWLENSGGRKVAGSSPVAPTFLFHFLNQVPNVSDCYPLTVSVATCFFGRPKRR